MTGTRCRHGMDERFCSLCLPKPKGRSQRVPTTASVRAFHRTTAETGRAWWLALDLTFTSYAELKARMVVAQGFPQLGDLAEYARMASSPANRAEFEYAIGALCERHYGENDGRAATGLWRFFQIATGDLVVALEGTTVRGITRMNCSASDGYWLDRRYNYGQCIGRQQVWIDWDAQRIRWTPTAPAHSVLAAAQIQKDRGLVFAAWALLSGAQPS